MYSRKFDYKEHQNSKTISQTREFILDKIRQVRVENLVKIDKLYDSFPFDF